MVLNKKYLRGDATLCCPLRKKIFSLGSKSQKRKEENNGGGRRLAQHPDSFLGFVQKSNTLLITSSVEKNVIKIVSNKGALQRTTYTATI